MSDIPIINTADRIAQKIAEVDALITIARSEADAAVRLVAQLKMKNSIRKVKELEALKEQLQSIQTEVATDEMEVNQ